MSRRTFYNCVECDKRFEGGSGHVLNRVPYCSKCWRQLIDIQDDLTQADLASPKTSEMEEACNRRIEMMKRKIYKARESSRKGGKQEPYVPGLPEVSTRILWRDA